jgi:hypothetical protein
MIISQQCLMQYLLNICYACGCYVVVVVDSLVVVVVESLVVVVDSLVVVVESLVVVVVDSLVVVVVDSLFVVVVDSLFVVIVESLVASLSKVNAVVIFTSQLESFSVEAAVFGTIVV